jgi:hypothetical protein
MAHYSSSSLPSQPERSDTMFIRSRMRGRCRYKPELDIQVLGGRSPKTCITSWVASTVHTICTRTQRRLPCPSGFLCHHAATRIWCSPCRTTSFTNRCAHFHGTHAKAQGRVNPVHLTGFKSHPPPSPNREIHGALCALQQWASRKMLLMTDAIQHCSLSRTALCAAGINSP